MKTSPDESDSSRQPRPRAGEGEPHDEGTEITADVELDLDEDFTLRIRAAGPPQAVEKLIAVAVETSMQQLERKRRSAENEGYRRQFFTAAHVLIFGVAAVSVAGLIAVFLNFRTFDTRALYAMGIWVIISIAWLYFAIIKDIFGVKTSIPKPPKLP